MPKMLQDFRKCWGHLKKRETMNDWPWGLEEFQQFSGQLPEAWTAAWNTWMTGEKMFFIQTPFISDALSKEHYWNWHRLIEKCSTNQGIGPSLNLISKPRTQNTCRPLVFLILFDHNVGDNVEEWETSLTPMKIR